MKFLVFIEQREGKIRKASLEALSVARRLAGSQVIRQRSTVDWDVTVVIGRDQARALAGRP